MNLFGFFKRKPSHPKAIAVTVREGGDWIEFPSSRGHVVHSILFDDGSVWDAFNGWRSTTPYYDNRRMVVIHDHDGVARLRAIA